MLLKNNTAEKLLQNKCFKTNTSWERALKTGLDK